MSLACPLFLLLIPVSLILLLPVSGKVGAAFPSLRLADGLRKSGSMRIRAVARLLAITGLCFVSVALARPRTRLDDGRKQTQGIAMQLVVDVSSSMNEEIDVHGEFIRRMDIAKKTFHDFVFGDGKTLPGRENDLVGLITFARYADTLSPLSGSHNILRDFLSTIDTVRVRAEDGTSIGDALALSAARLAQASSENDRNPDYTISSKIIVLLTDGENNAGERTPLESAALARDLGIKIYTIGFAGQAYRTVSGLFGTRRVAYAPAVDSATLTAISEMTGGKYFEAGTPEDLISVYETIDSLEKSAVESITQPRYNEMYYLAAFPGFILLAAAFLLRQFFFRGYP